MADQPGSDASAESLPAPDYATYERTANAADLGQSSSSDVTPESSPDPSGTQSAPTGAKVDAASEPATPDGQKPPRNLDTRHRDVDEKIAELKRKLEIKRELEFQLGERHSPAKPATSQPAKPSEPEWKRYAKHPNAPKSEQFDSYEEFVTAQAVFIADQRFAERDQYAKLDAESRERMSETEQTIKGFRARLDKGREADPDFESKIAPGLLKIEPAFALPPSQRPGPHNVLLQEVVTSEFSNELLLHFSTKEGEAEWIKLCESPNLAAMVRAFGRLEARFASSGQAATGDKPAAKPVTSAPAPPRVMGGKPLADPDRAASAVNAGDFSAYAAAADAADLARLRGR